MITDDGYVDGSWELTITVDDLVVERTIRVHGDWHVGGIMFKLVESLELKLDWSDHALWWPGRNRWLLHTRTTLDQYGVQSDARLRFLRMHNTLHVQLPDLQVHELRVNYAKSVFSVVVELCKELRIRHPEEVSLMRSFTKADLKRPRIGNYRRPESVISPNSNGHGVESPIFNRRHHPNQQPLYSPTSDNNNGYDIIGSSYMPQQLSVLGSPSIMRSAFTAANPNFITMPSTLGSPGTTPRANGGGHTGGSSTPQFPTSLNSLTFEGADDSILARSSHVSAYEAFEVRGLPRVKSYLHRARINGAWLDSSKSLMEQCIEPDTETVALLRFKYFSFYDLNAKYDAIRINQLYHQARWSLLTEEVECTEEEMYVFGGLQFQIELQNNQPQVEESEPDSSEPDKTDDEIDAIIDQLQMTLEGGTNLQRTNGAGEVRQIPTLSGYLKIFRPRKFSLKNYKEYWTVLRDSRMQLFKFYEGVPDTEAVPCDVINLRGCELQPDVNISTEKFGIRLFVPNGKLMQEVWLRCPNQESYAEWTAACKLASRGKTMASKGQYESEKQTTLTFLRLQEPKEPVEECFPESLFTNPQQNIVPANYLAHKFLKKAKEKVGAQRLLEAHANVRQMSLRAAKMHYIRAWQQLPHYGLNYFVVKFGPAKREELVGVALNRVMMMDLDSGDILQTWRFNEMKSWHVNWEVREMVLNFPREKVAFRPVSATCKVVHEIVGGYIFLGLRTPERSQELDEETYHKYTGGAI